MHGSGDNPNDTFSVWGTAAEHGMRLIVVRSAKRFAPEAFSWDKRSSAKDLRLILEATNAFSPIVLGGFSQGASLPLWNALAGELDVTGISAVCPTIRPESNRTPTPDEIAAAVIRGDRRRGCSA